MSTKNSWWQQYREAITCSKLRQEISLLVNDRQDVVDRLIDAEKNRHPDKSESWCLNKVICNLKQAA